MLTSSPRPTVLSAMPSQSAEELSTGDLDLMHTVTHNGVTSQIACAQYNQAEHNLRIAFPRPQSELNVDGVSKDDIRVQREPSGLPVKIIVKTKQGIVLFMSQNARWLRPT